MIYIVEKYSDMTEHHEIDSVWEVDADDVEERYKKWMIDFATDVRKIVINPHWLNMMNHKDHHPHLSAEEYKQKEKSWEKFLNSRTIEWYIKEKLKGKRLNYKTTNSK